MRDHLSAEQIIKARREIEHGLKTIPDVPTRRYLEAKDKELLEALEAIEYRKDAA